MSLFVLSFLSWILIWGRGARENEEIKPDLMSRLDGNMYLGNRQNVCCASLWSMDLKLSVFVVRTTNTDSFNSLNSWSCDFPSKF